MNLPAVALFDAYGTLFDVHSAVARYANEMGPNAESISQLWRLKQLEYTWTRSLMGHYADFWTLTSEALDHALAMYGLRSNTVLRNRLLDAYWHLEVYPEVIEVLADYHRFGLRVGVFSNATSDMLWTALRSAGLESSVDIVHSVHVQRIYKPARQVYAAVTEALSVPVSVIRFHSANAWDAAGAASFGWNAVWINRNQGPQEYPWAPVGGEYCDLRSALAGLRNRTGVPQVTHTKSATAPLIRNTPTE